MRTFTLLGSICWVLALCFAPAVLADHDKHNDKHAHKHHGYHLVEDFHRHNFFDKFRFFDHPDPTNGFVQYVDRHTANKTGLIKTYNNFTYVGVDHKNVYDPNGLGRPSVRLESHKAFTYGLFVLGLTHMPHGCGTWPAWWTLGPRWPYTGEIDIIEGVNNNEYNLMSLHTSAGCTIAGAKQKGELVTNNCDSLEQNTGCGVLQNATKSYGKGFNRDNGGVYAMEWTPQAIRIWKWSHEHVPKSLKKGKPEPEKDFGKPDANMAGSCNIPRHFREHYIVFDNTFCGDFAGAAYEGSNCPLSSRGSRGCNEFVAENPQAFKEAYWGIKHLHVYQKPGSEEQKYKPKYYSSVVPYVSSKPHVVSTLIPPGNGHNTTANHVPTTFSESLHLSTANPPKTKTTSHPKTTTTSHKLSTSIATPGPSKKSSSKSSTVSSTRRPSRTSTSSSKRRSSTETSTSSSTKKRTSFTSSSTTSIHHPSTSSTKKRTSFTSSSTTSMHHPSTSTSSSQTSSFTRRPFRTSSSKLTSTSTQIVTSSVRSSQTQSFTSTTTTPFSRDKIKQNHILADGLHHGEVEQQQANHEHHDKKKHHHHDQSNNKHKQHHPQIEQHDAHHN